MRILGLLSFYDEPADALAACVQSLAAAGVEHVVAVDGAYALYPGAADRPCSPLGQTGALAYACREAGLGLSLHLPAGPWAGGEVEKRTHMFTAALADAQPGEDWLMVMDADQVVLEVPSDLRERLAGAEEDVAAVTFRDRVAAKANDPMYPASFDVRILFRAQPIHLEVSHYTYIASLTGRPLWTGRAHDAEPGPGLDLRGCVVVEHRPDVRGPRRRAAKEAYYREREARGIERGPCDECAREGRDRPSKWRMPAKWSWPVGASMPVSEIAELCEEHGLAAERRNAKRLKHWGIDPGSVKAVERNGVPPGAGVGVAR